MNFKEKPEDFCVEELIKLNKKKIGDYAYFWLTKNNWTTQRAINAVARALRISQRKLKFAGTKDKHAVTKQAVSAFKIKKEDLEKIKIKDIEIKFIGYGENQISLGDLTGNKFRIIARDLTKEDLELFSRKIKEIKKSGFPNYFGEQRFGKGNTHLIGREIIKGRLWDAVRLILTFRGERESMEASEARQFAEENWGNWKDIIKKFPRFLGLESAVLNWLITYPNDFAGGLRKIPKPIRKMYIHAYQSWVFNKALEKTGAKGKLTVPGYESKLGNSTFDKEIKKILKEEGIKLEDFKCTRVPELASAGDFREAVVKVKKFKAGKIQKDELNKGKSKIKLEFELPKGVYATVLLQELFNGRRN